MRHYRIARATLVIAGVFVVAAMVFAGVGTFFADEGATAAGGPEPAVVDGAERVVAGEGAMEFEARCGRCHDRGDFVDWAQAHPDPTARGEWLGSVLQKHFPPPKQERAAIIGHIQRGIGDAGD